MRCVVTGSGVAGLAAALLLARQGHDVTVVEACRHAAPLLRGFTREGLHFDTGFHCGGGLHPGGALRRWLRALGVEADLQDISTTHSAVFCFADGSEYRLPSGVQAVTDAAERQFPGTGHGMNAFLRRAEAELSSSPYLNPTVRDAPGGALQDGATLNERLDAAAFPPHLRAMLGSRCLLYGVFPSEASWRDFSLVAGPYFQSCGTWRGGGAALAEALLRALREARVAVRLGRAVTGIEADTATGVRGVLLGDGTRIACERCFFTGHPAQLARLTPPGLLRPAYLHRIDDMPETSPALLLFAETRDALRDDESLYLLPSPQAASSDAELFPSLEAEDPGIYVFCDRPAADGRRAVMVVSLLHGAGLAEGDPQPRPRAYLDWKRRAAEQARRAVERRVPRLRGAWRILDAATPLTLRRWVYGGTGSLYGVRHHRAVMPLLPVTRVPGLFLAGQNALLPGVLGGIVSAALAVGFAFGHDAALKEFRECAENE